MGGKIFENFLSPGKCMGARFSVSDSHRAPIHYPFSWLGVTRRLPGIFIRSETRDNFNSRIFCKPVEKNFFFWLGVVGKNTSVALSFCLL